MGVNSRLAFIQFYLPVPWPRFRARRGAAVKYGKEFCYFSASSASGSRNLFRSRRRRPKKFATARKLLSCPICTVLFPIVQERETECGNSIYAGRKRLSVLAIENGQPKKYFVFVSLGKLPGNRIYLRAAYTVSKRSMPLFPFPTTLRSPPAMAAPKARPSCFTFEEEKQLNCAYDATL